MVSEGKKVMYTGRAIANVLTLYKYPSQSETAENKPETTPEHLDVDHTEVEYLEKQIKQLETNINLLQEALKIKENKITTLEEKLKKIADIMNDVI